MSHEIMELDRPMFASVPAWHGLGTVIPDAFELTPSTRDDLLSLSGLKWRALESEVLTASGQARAPDGTLISFSSQAPNHKAIIRSDTHDVLGVVGSGYTVIQNSGLANFLTELAASPSVKIETAGSIQNGRRVWMAARTPGFTINGNDPVQPYLMVTNRHDGRGPFIAKLTSIRPVCWNTLTAALGQKTPEFRIRHTSNAASQAADAAQVLGLALQATATLQEQATFLSSQTIGSADLSRFFLQVFETLHGPVNPNPTTPTEERRLRSSVKTVAAMHETFDHERSLLGATANRWLAFNAASKHVQSNRLREDPDTNFESLLFGTRDTSTSTLLDLALTTA